MKHCSTHESRIPHRASRPERERARGTVVDRAMAGGRAFTLIELLAVIGVIAVLAALLFPVLRKGKAGAQQVQCVSNLRQLGFAAQMYWDDNDGHAFRYRGIATNGGDVYWFGWLARGSEGARPFEPALGALFPYLGKSNVEICPALDYAMRRFKLKATGAAYGYGYNLRLSAPGNQRPLNISRLVRPSEITLLADAAQVNTFQAPATPDNPMIEEFYYVSTNEATAHFRHTKRASVLFCDGHVAAEKPAPDSLDRRLPGQVIGRLRTEILVVP